MRWLARRLLAPPGPLLEPEPELPEGAELPDDELPELLEPELPDEPLELLDPLEPELPEELPAAGADDPLELAAGAEDPLELDAAGLLAAGAEDPLELAVCRAA